MKLLYITNGINGSGGLERVLSVKASYLAEQHDYDVQILVLNQMHENPFYEFSPKIKYHTISVGGNPLQYWKTYKSGIQKIVDEIQPDVIAVCDDGLKGFFVPSFLKTKAKLIYERHASINLNTNTSLKGRLVAYFMKKQVSKFDKFVVLTQGNKNEWNKENVVVVPNPLSFETMEKSSLENKKIIAVGSQSHNKGYDLLIQSWKIIEEKYSDWSLSIFGKIDENQTFIKLAKKENLKNIAFHQPTQTIKDNYLDSSILVLSSRSEGFGMVLIEAMECGLPCVSFDCPSGPADIINNGEDGFLVEKENVAQLAEKLMTLIENEDLRKQMGQKAKENVKRYAAVEVVKKWDALFKELIA